MFIISQGSRGWLFNFIICRYGDMTDGVGILMMLFGYACFLFMSVRSPPLAGVYGIFVVYTLLMYVYC